MKEKRAVSRRSICLGGTLLALWSGIAMAQSGGSMGRTPPKIESLQATELAGRLSSSNGRQRSAASAELFRRGHSVLKALEQAGAHPMATIHPSRLDVVYTLLQGLKAGPYRENSFGLHLEPSASREAIVQMGKRHGFLLPAETTVGLHTAPTCYVRIQPGHTLPEVLKSLLTTEPAVLTVSLDYVE